MQSLVGGRQEGSSRPGIHECSASSGTFTLSTTLAVLTDDSNLVVTCVYAPCSVELRPAFLAELVQLAANNGDRPWLVFGDFTLTCGPADRNNNNFDAAAATIQRCHRGCPSLRAAPARPPLHLVQPMGGSHPRSLGQRFHKHRLGDIPLQLQPKFSTTASVRPCSAHHHCIVPHTDWPGVPV